MGPLDGKSGRPKNGKTQPQRIQAPVSPLCSFLIFCRGSCGTFAGILLIFPDPQNSERPRSLLLPLGVPSRTSPGSYPGPVQVPSQVRGVPVQIRHVLCFTVLRTHPGPEVGPSRPVLVPSCSRAFLPGSGLEGPKQTSWPLPKNKGLKNSGYLRSISHKKLRN